MKLIQLSDTHLRGDGKLAFRVADTKKALDECVNHLINLEQKPDVIVVTGDLADGGDWGAYQIFHAAFKTLGIPVYVLPGNHDKRDRILDIMPEFCPADKAIEPYLCYTVEGYPIRIVMLDTMRPGKHMGFFDEPAQVWLDKTLSENMEKPTIVFTHHVPFKTAMEEMDEPFENADKLADILKKYKNVRLSCGHMHRPITTLWEGGLAMTCPSVSMQIYLDFSKIGGDSFVMETAGYMVHHFYNGAVNSHVCQIPSNATFSGPHKFVDSVNPV